MRKNDWIVRDSYNVFPPPLMSPDEGPLSLEMDPADAIAPFSQPGIVTIPLAFLTLVIVSLLTEPHAEKEPA